RDALVGIALFLTHMAKIGGTVSAYRASLPQYFMSKNKITLTPDLDIERLLAKMEEKDAHENPAAVDGLQITFENERGHLRKSNSEPIIRVFSEGPTVEAAEGIAQRIMNEINEIIG